MTSSFPSSLVVVGGSVAMLIVAVGVGASQMRRKKGKAKGPKNPFETDSRREAPPPLDGAGWRKLQKDRDVVIKNVYTPNKIPKELDVIVVGSGCGGLTTAAILARAGKRVLVLEQHDRAGGATHGFADRGYEYDPGIHYIGEMQHDTTLRFFLDQLTEGQMQWAPMHRHYDTAVFGDKQIPIDTGREAFCEALGKHFPTEKEAIDNYVNFMESWIKEAMGIFAGLKIMPRWLARVLVWIPFVNRPFKRFLKYAGMTGAQVISQFTTNPDLIAALSYPWGDYGLTPSHGSFFLTAAITDHYLEGGSYPVGGSSQFAFYVIPAILRAGGAVLVKAPVKQLLSEGKRIIGVEMMDGVQIFAPQVVSNAGIVNTLTKLLPPSISAKVDPALLRKTRASGSCLSLFVGLRGSHEELGIAPRQYWKYRSTNYDADLTEFSQIPDAHTFVKSVSPNFPFIFITFPSAKDPAYQAMHPDSVTCSVITAAPFEWFCKHSDEPATRRSEAYNELKNELGMILWKQVLELFPQLADRVDYFEVGTPLTMQHYLSYQKGAAYGLDHDPSRFSLEMILALRADIGVPGLYLTGQDIGTCGFGSCLFAGLITATSCLGRDIYGDLMNLKKNAATLRH